MNFFKKFLPTPRNSRDTPQPDEQVALADFFDLLMRHSEAPPNEIETEVDPDTFTRLQARVERTWSRLGKEDAHWSVITDNKFRKENIDNTLTDFFDMGEGDVKRLLAALHRAGAQLSRVRSVMDFGCGVGRLSVILSRHFDKVIGVDISPSHLREANSYFRSLGIENIQTRKLTSVSEIETLEKCDLVYSIIVLQHNPPPVMRELLSRLCSRVERGGFLYVQIPTYKVGYSYSSDSDLLDNTDSMEMHILPQKVVFDVIEKAGLSIREVVEDGAAWNLDFRSQAFLAQRK